MKISTKGRYGLRAMMDMAVHASSEHVAVRNIAERQNISENYLEQVFSVLKKSGLVKSVKGAQGGYVLANKPSNITVGTILRVLEGDLSVMDDIDDSTSSEEIRRIRCSIRKNVWDVMNSKINEVVDSMTLQNLADEYSSLLGKKVPMYYI